MSWFVKIDLLTNEQAISGSVVQKKIWCIFPGRPGARKESSIVNK